MNFKTVYNALAPAQDNPSVGITHTGEVWVSYDGTVWVKFSKYFAEEKKE